MTIDTNYFAPDRLFLFDYALNAINLFTNKARALDGSAITEASINLLDVIHKGSTSISIVVKFMWNKLFTDWDRLSYEFTFPNFKKKEFNVITKADISFLSFENKKVHRNLSILLAKNGRKATYLYIFEYINSIYKELTTFELNLKF